MIRSKIVRRTIDNIWKFNNKNNVLLQTACAKLSSVNLDISIGVRIIFDSGSQKTHVSNKVRNFLKLPTIRKEQVFIHVWKL